MKNLITKLLYTMSVILFIGISSKAQQPSIGINILNTEPDAFCLKDRTDYSEQNKPDQTLIYTDITFEVVGADDLDDASYSWDFDDGTDPVTVSTNTVTHRFRNPTSTSTYSDNTYRVTLTVTLNDNSELTKTKDVQIYGMPNVTFGVKVNGETTSGFEVPVYACEGDLIELRANYTDNDYNILWSAPNAGQNYPEDSKKFLQLDGDNTNGKSVQRYGVVVYNENLCQTKRWVDVTYYEQPEITHISASQTSVVVEYGETATLRAEGDVCDSYTWDVVNGTAGSLNAYNVQEVVAGPRETTVYSVTGKRNGCESEPETVEITIEAILGTAETPISANNVIYPDGTYNREWIIDHVEWYEGGELYIYNSWGKEVYNATLAPSFKWNGTSNDGDELPQDAYYYLVRVQNKDGKTIDHTGSITILR